MLKIDYKALLYKMKKLGIEHKFDAPPAERGKAAPVKVMTAGSGQFF
jgi:hypothetical protein